MPRGSIRCAPGCTCRKHSVETKQKIGASVSKSRTGKKYGPQSAEHREKNRQAQLGNTRKLGKKHTPEQRARRSTLTKRMWVEGYYDNKPHPAWGKPGVHAGVKMHCLNSEGVFARDLDNAGIEWQYQPRRFRLSWCSYEPDFYLPEFDIWVEIKGYAKQPGKWRQKVESLRREAGKTIIVIFQSELSSMNYGGEYDE